MGGALRSRRDSASGSIGVRLNLRVWRSESTGAWWRRLRDGWSSNVAAGGWPAGRVGNSGSATEGTAEWGWRRTRLGNDFGRLC